MEEGGSEPNEYEYSNVLFNVVLGSNSRLPKGIIRSLLLPSLTSCTFPNNCRGRSS